MCVILNENVKKQQKQSFLLLFCFCFVFQHFVSYRSSWWISPPACRGMTATRSSCARNSTA